MNQDLEIAAADVAEQLKGETPPLLLDVREPDEWQMARLEGARLIPMGDLSVRFTELDPEQETVVYCHRGRRSLNVVLWLRAQGFSRVRSLRGGIDGWSREIDPSIPRY